MISKIENSGFFRKHNQKNELYVFKTNNLESEKANPDKIHDIDEFENNQIDTKSDSIESENAKLNQNHRKSNSKKSENKFGKISSISSDSKTNNFEAPHFLNFQPIFEFCTSSTIANRGLFYMAAHY